MPEADVVEELLAQLTVSDTVLDSIGDQAEQLVDKLRANNDPTLMEAFLAEYGLSTPEGVGLMCLAEALLRVPDAITIDELIADKLDSSNWSAHLGQSSSPLVNASTWALMLTGRLLDDSESPTSAISSLLKRAGEPLIRTAVAQAMKLLGKQFVLGEDINQAVAEAKAQESAGYTYSYDMLGEAAYTLSDAKRYHDSYANAIARLAQVKGASIRDKPGISVKLSALHPRYESTHRNAVLTELFSSVQILARMAAKSDIGFNIDAEEADRLDLSLDVIEKLLADDQLAGWDGLGIVVQAYSRRAMPVIDWLLAAAERYDRKIMVRLVKGAYWDSEIKQAQELGLASFPVFTKKENTDVSYLACAEKLLANRHRIYPQFATHNAHSVTAIRLMAGSDTEHYEFQRLHGMGESLHETVRKDASTRCRIYAPVGAHRDLLAYLVRRLLENGANSSFVNQIVDERIPSKIVVKCPVRLARQSSSFEHPKILHPMDLYQPHRKNSKGFRINDPASIGKLIDERKDYRHKQWTASSVLFDHAPNAAVSEKVTPVHSPANPKDIVGTVSYTSHDDVLHALKSADAMKTTWQRTPVSERAAALESAANAFENATAELCALLCREAGKTLTDAISEVREAVDFLRYYAADARGLNAASPVNVSNAHGVVVCISPWNFPLAIFTGQVAGALVAGNVVMAKPAEQTPLIAARAVSLLLEAGIPRFALQLLVGDGASVGKQLTQSPLVNAVCFTGSTMTSRHIERSLASRTDEDIEQGATPNPLLMAETGGINAMIVDSSALTEQVVRDTLASAFQSAGQRCSALRMLYVQEEAKERLLSMLTGAMDCMTIGDPWNISTDVGPVINQTASDKIKRHIKAHADNGNLIHQSPLNQAAQRSDSSLWVRPTLISVNSISDLPEEIFGPVLHIASFDAKDIESTIDDINHSGYGLTFGLHTRIDDRVQHVVDSIHAGNVYVNRNQIGAVVGSQPFGGEGLSGTGPKAGGPWYVSRLMNAAAPSTTLPTDNTNNNGLVLPGPTGESNHWNVVPRSPVLLISSDPARIENITRTLDTYGCHCISVDVHSAEHSLLSLIDKHQAKLVLAPDAIDRTLLSYRQKMAMSDGELIPLIDNTDDPGRFFHERHVCIDTTAAGGNASLLGSVDE